MVRKKFVISPILTKGIANWKMKNALSKKEINFSSLSWMISGLFENCFNNLNKDVYSLLKRSENSQVRLIEIIFFY